MIEVLKQALEALERSVATCFDQYAHQQVMSQPDHFINQAITSLRQAIAELESQDGACQHCAGKGCVACDAREQEPVAWLRTSGIGSPVVTNEMFNAYPEMRWSFETPLYTHPSQPAKPIPCANNCEATAFEIVIKNLQGEIERLKAPQRTWVGLTPADMEELSAAWWEPNENEMALIDWVDAKLKEKNNA